MTIFILGSTGMLGNYVTTYLKKKYSVIEINRSKLDANTITELELNTLFTEYHIHDDVIINCMGVIKHILDKNGILNAVKINTLFPHMLASVALSHGAKVIHASTDCVFDGLRGSYDENDVTNPTDVYGKTKALGESENITVIRTSIIGEELKQKKSLIEWVKSNKDGMIDGFTNHWWNGITCLQFAKICDEIVSKNLFWKGVRHIYSNSVSKYELVQLINNYYNLNIIITAKRGPVYCNRVLTSIYPLEINIPTIEAQMIELKNF
jgi:dTDP-4-dehydrorhamnose reductase